MRHLTRGGGSVAPRRARRARSLALVATFLMLMAGMIVSNPNLINASAGTKPSATKSDSSGDGHGNGRDDASCADKHDGDTDDDGQDQQGDNAENADNSSDSTDSTDSPDTSSGSSSDNGDSALVSTGNSDTGNSDTGNGDVGSIGDGNHEDSEGGDHHGGAPCVATIEVHKVPANSHGGTLQAADFQLLLDGQPQAQLIDTPVAADVAHVVTEVPQPGYELQSIVCTDLATGAQVSGNGAVTPSAGQRGLV